MTRALLLGIVVAAGLAVAWVAAHVVSRSGGSAEAYPRTMGRAAAEITGVRTVIPGHGPSTTWHAFADSAAALRR